MLKRIRALILVLTIMFGSMLAMSPVVLADARTEICDGVAAAGGGTGCTPGSGPTVQSVVAKVVNILSFVVGVVAVIMVIVGGIKYVTSSGDSNNVNSAKNTILYAIVGLVVAVMAQILVKYVLNTVAPATTTTSTEHAISTGPIHSQSKLVA